MAVKVYGLVNSTCTELVLITCHELGVEYELMTVNLFKGEQYDPQWIATKNPFAAVPVLIDEDGTQIFESRAIARYLVLKYGPKSRLLPPTSDLNATALFEQAASIEYSSFSPRTNAIYFEYLYAGGRIEGREVNQGFVEENRAKLLKSFEGYERILSKQKILGWRVAHLQFNMSETITLADLFHITFGTALHARYPDIFDPQPNLKRWWDDITSRESWKAVSALQ